MAKQNAGGLEFKSAPLLDLKVVDGEGEAMKGRVVEAYASIFGNVDSGEDRMHRGAFAQTISEDAKRIRVCWNHYSDFPIGRPLLIEEHSNGLFTRSYISDTSRGNDALTLLRDGAVNEMSIGYTTVRYEMDEEAGVRELLQVKLWEYSPVTWAMNELAQVTGIKEDFRLALKRVCGFTPDLKEGRVLSRRNRALAQSALEALQELLAAVDAEEDDGKSLSDPAHLDECLEEADPADLKAATEAANAWLEELKAAQELREFANSLRG